MKILTLVAFVSISSLSFCEIDWRATALTNAAIDTVQTNYFMDHGGEERWNPLVAGMVNSGDHLGFTISAVGGAYLLDRGLQSIRDRNLRTIGYIVWSLAEVAACYNNSREFGFLFPVVAIRW